MNFVESFSYKQDQPIHKLFLKNNDLSFNGEISEMQNYCNLFQQAQEVNDGDIK